MKVSSFPNKVSWDFHAGASLGRPRDELQIIGIHWKYLLSRNWDDPGTILVRPRTILGRTRDELARVWGMKISEIAAGFPYEMGNTSVIFHHFPYNIHTNLGNFPAFLTNCREKLWGIHGSLINSHQTS